MKYALLVNDGLVCDPINDHHRLADVAARHGFTVVAPFGAPVTQTIAGKALQVLPGIEERPDPPAVVGYQPRLTSWQLDADNQRLVRTLEYLQLPFAEMVDEVQRYVDDQQDQALARIEHGYTAQEVKTWPQQQAEAARWLSDNAAVVPLLAQLAQRRGVAVADVVAKIQAKVQQAAVLTGIVLGDAQAASARVDAMRQQFVNGSLPDTWFEQLTGLALSWRFEWPPELLPESTT